jgi:hypothetical protein
MSGGNYGNKISLLSKSLWVLPRFLREKTIESGNLAGSAAGWLFGRGGQSWRVRIVRGEHRPESSAGSENSNASSDLEIVLTNHRQPGHRNVFLCARTLAALVHGVAHP